jgi:hypothetical protein
MLRIQNGDVKLLDRKILQLVPEYLVHIARAADGNSILPIFSGHPAPELEGSVNLHCSGIADAGERGEGSNRLG